MTSEVRPPWLGATRATWLARAVLVISLALLALVFLVLALTAGSTAAYGGLLARQLPLLSFGIVGYVIALRRPANPVAWLLMAIGLASSVQACIGVAGFRLAPPGAVRGTMTALFLVLGNIMLGLFPLAILLFPSGRPPARPLRLLLYPLALVYLAYAAFNVLGWRGSEDEPNPLFVEAFAGPIPLVVGAVLGAGTVVALASPIWRWWRAVGRERSQLKWLALAALIALGLLFADVGPFRGFRGDLAFSLFPAAAGIAILRDRLFDIDFVINRSVLYGIVVVILIAAYEALAYVAERLLGPLQRDQLGFVRPLLAVAVIPGFWPLERRLRPLVDRLLPATERLALLFTDIVGATDVASAIGDARWRDLLGRYRAAVRRELQRSGGVEVDTAGDGFFATFRDPLGAARCALSIAPATSDLGLRTRAGLHAGDRDMRGGKPIGINVHLAARVMAAADGDVVLASESFQEVLAGSGAVFEALGPRRLKGIPGEIYLYRLAAA